MPIFLMTFGICMFIVLMQFLWKYVDEMVGKGLEISVLLEMFFYAALSLVPMALPLAILLASLMTFGNLGEQLELLAMKSAGISLPRIMRPFIKCGPSWAPSGPNRPNCKSPKAPSPIKSKVTTSMSREKTKTGD